MVIRTETADLAATTSTGVVLTPGDTFYGRISSGSDHDFIALDVVAGQSYTIAMVGVGATILTDVFLQLRAADGSTLMAEDDDSLRNHNARISFTAAETGRVYIDASGYGGKQGSYGVTVAQNATPSFDLPMIAGIIDSHSAWSPTRGTGTNLTFAFRESTSGGQPNFLQFTAGQMADTRAVLAHFAEVTGLTFTEVNPGGYSNDATLLYGNYSASDGAGGYGSYPGSRDSAASAGDVWVNDDTPSTTASGFGSWFRELMLHEIGHTLGLSHPGNYNAGVGVSITYAANADFVQDSSQYTLMSYFGGDETGGTGGSPDTLMLADMLALHQIYGANMATRAGNSFYGFGASAGDVYDFDINLSPNFTIWDGGGNDRIDASRFAMDQIIRLGAGQYSSIGGYVNNITIAHGVTMENANGGRGDDLIIGNAAVNRLNGGLGDDTLDGGAQRDTLTGGLGADVLLGGAGNDVLLANGTSATAPETFNLATTDYSASAKLRGTALNLFPNADFTVEFLWQQNDLADQHYSVDIGSLSLYRHDDGKVSLMFWDATEAGWSWNALPPTLTDGGLHRLSLSYHDASGVLKIYLDGALFGSETFAPGTRGLAATDTLVLDDDAAVGDLRIFDHVRTDAEIWSNAWTALPDPTAEAGLVQYWQADTTGHLRSAIGGTDLTSQGATGWVQATPQITLSADTLDGGSGNDTLTIDSADDVIIELAGGGDDLVYASTSYTLTAGAAVETLMVQGNAGIALTGNERAQSLISGAGADTLAGGLGRDVLDGGVDLVADHFVFATMADLGRAATRDVINNYVAGLDVIDLSAIDADLISAGDQAFRLTTGAASFALWTVSTATGLVLRLDNSGDGTADGELRLAGVLAMNMADVLL